MTKAQLEKSLAAARDAAARLRAAPAGVKNDALSRLEGALLLRTPEILKANAQDLKALPKSAAPAFRERLTLTAERIQQMAASLASVRALTDPVGEEVSRAVLPSGLLLRRVRAPLGVIFLIYESRPNVAIEAFSIAFKAGNAMILRGGKESRRTVAVLYELIADSLKAAGLPAECAWGITDQSRDLVKSLLARADAIDVVIPRGGAGLIAAVTKSSRIPVIKNDRGMCHIYVDEAADLHMAAKVAVNAKCSRPGVCNATETVLVHKAVAPELLPQLYDQMRARGVQIRGCPATLKILGKRQGLVAAKPKDWDTEHLDLILNLRVVKSMTEALAHIATHGSRHSEAIITAVEATARRFQTEVDAAAVYWNASTRFTDGFEFGLGGEVGISTQKLHARGPVGLRELTSARWVADGSGQTR